MGILSGIFLAAAWLLIIAGAGKLSGAIGTVGTDGAIRRALRIRPGTWRLAAVASGVSEMAIGGLAVLGVFPLLTAALVLALGLSFCGLLGYARRARVGGSCGCTGAFGKNRTAGSWDTWARAVIVAAGGIAALPAARYEPAGPAWRDPVAVTVALAVDLPVLAPLVPLRTPHCYRFPLLSLPNTLRDLGAHPLFAATASALGGVQPRFAHRRSGCAEEFSFPLANRDQACCLRFEVTRGHSGALAVRATLTPGITKGRLRPARHLPVSALGAGST